MKIIFTLHLICLIIFSGCESNFLKRDPINIDEVSIPFESIIIDDSLINNSGATILSHFVSDLKFIKIAEDTISSNYRIKKIRFTNNGIIILWDSSNDICIYDREGIFIKSIKKDILEISTMRPIDIFFEQKDKTLIVLLEGGNFIKCTIDKEYNLSIIDLIEIGENNVLEIVKIPETDVYALSFVDETRNIILTKSFPVTSKSVIFQTKVSSSSAENVALRESFVYDDSIIFFRRYSNDTIFRLLENEIFPNLVFRECKNNFFKDSTSLKRIDRVTLSFFFYLQGSFYSKVLVDREEYYLIKTFDKKIISFSSHTFENDVYGSNNFNCIGVDTFSGSFIFQIPSRILNRYRASDNEIINKEYFSKIDDLNIESEESIVLVLIKF